MKNSRFRRRLPGLVLAASGVAVLMLGGCVQRTVTITSNPEGALVHLNGREVGRTPVDVDFEVYGEYDVRLQLEGYEPLATSGNADGPWWDGPGPDLLVDLSPMRETVHLRWHYEMTPEESDTAALADRARALRDYAVSPAAPE